jgi:hypothetical protein
MEGISLCLCNELSFFLFELWNFNLEFIANLSSCRAIKPIKKMSQNSEGFRNHASYFSTMVTLWGYLTSYIKHTNSSKRRSHPKLFIIKST